MISYDCPTLVVVRVPPPLRAHRTLLALSSSVRSKTLLNDRQRSRCLQSVQRFQENGATVFYISHALIASVFMYTSISSSPGCYVHGDGDDTYQKGLYFGHGKVTSPHTDNMCNAKINLNIGAYSFQRSNKTNNHKTPARAKPKESWYQKPSDEVAENFATTCVWASCRRRPNLNRGAQHNAQPTCLICWPGLVGEEHYVHEHHDIHRDHFQHHHQCNDLLAPSLSGHRSSDSCILPLILLLP